MKMTFIVGCSLAALCASAANAGGRGDPDWPCEQIKVGQLSVAAFWDGPAIDAAAAGWRRDPKVSALAEALIQRRLPIERAEEQIIELGRDAGAARSQVMTALFADVFDALNAERETVLSGLDRFGRRQKEIAAELREEGQVLRAAQASQAPGDAKLNDLTRQIMWDNRVYEARRQSVRYACDVPAVIEQRLYRLAKAIRQQID